MTDPPPSPQITSFVIRFIHSVSPEFTEYAYRGTILHIPSGEELAFIRWEDAVEFIQRYVPLNAVESPLSGSLAK